MDSEFEVKIDKRIWDGSLGIYFISRRNGKIFVAKPTQLEFVEVQPVDNVEPSLKFSHYFAKDILKAFAEALDQDGVKTENDFKVQGLLEATKFHLSDLRKLLKLDGKK